MISWRDQIELFAGCVYVSHLNRVRLPNGVLLDHAQVRSM